MSIFKGFDGLDWALFSFIVVWVIAGIGIGGIIAVRQFHHHYSQDRFVIIIKDE